MTFEPAVSVPVLLSLRNDSVGCLACLLQVIVTPQRIIIWENLFEHDKVVHECNRWLLNEGLVYR